MSEASPVVVLGRITGTHGIRGELKIHSYSGDVSTLLSLEHLYVRQQGRLPEKLAISSLRPHGKKILVRFKGYEDINLAQKLTGSEILVYRSELPPLEPDEYYWCDLIGLNVETVDGIKVGVLDEIFETAANDVYSVKNGKKEHLIPALSDIVVSVDLDSKVMKIAPFEGLLDL